MNKIFLVIPREGFENHETIIEQGMYKDVSLVIGVIDSVYSISSRYESTVKAVNRFAKYVNINREEDEYTISDFLNKFKNYTGEKLADEVFKNRQRTSTKNGILKAQAIAEIIEIFHKYGIETKADLLQRKDIEEIKVQVKKVKGQTSGICFEYIMMHAGDLNRFKPDRQIKRFFEDLLKYGKLNEKELETAFFRELDIVKKKYPYFNARSFDSLIWEFMKQRDKLSAAYLKAALSDD